MYTPLYTILDQAINSQITLLNTYTPNEMYKPMGYMLELGGKRVRPLLTLIGCDIFDADPLLAVSSALSVELFHNFSLIHDDILDNAPIRRGKTTVHKKWNHNIALLSGDGMMVKAFSELSKSKQEYIPQLLELFSKTALEVCEGQQEDMNFETQSTVSIVDYIHMISYKTAVLLGCSLQMGAICANASSQNQNHIYEFGKHIGIAFQILDDLLDVYALDESFGKQLGGDIIANKKTFLFLKAFELASSHQSQLLTNLFNNKEISSLDKVKEVTTIYNELDIKDITIKEANYHTHIALEHLDKLECNITKKENLKNFALNLLHRQS